MASQLHTILNSIRTRDYATATENIAHVLQRKIEMRLTTERQELGKTLVREETESDFNWKDTFGFNKRGQVIFQAPGKMSLADVKEIDPWVVKVETHGREWKDWKNYDELKDMPGYVAMSVADRTNGGRTQKELIADLSRQGIPAMKWDSFYMGSTGVAVPLKYAKKTGKYLYGESVVREDTSGWTSHKRATPGKCAKCGKPAKWYHNRLDKKFCADCAPNDTMNRIQEDTNSKPLECLECGKKFRSSSADPKCPKCGGYDVDLSEGWSDERPRRHQCKSCYNIWMGPLDDNECPKCGKREFEEGCDKPHVNEGLWDVVKSMPTILKAASRITPERLEKAKLIAKHYGPQATALALSLDYDNPKEQEFVDRFVEKVRKGTV